MFEMNRGSCLLVIIILLFSDCNSNTRRNDNVSENGASGNDSLIQKRLVDSNGFLWRDPVNVTIDPMDTLNLPNLDEIDMGQIENCLSSVQKKHNFGSIEFIKTQHFAKKYENKDLQNDILYFRVIDDSLVLVGWK